MLSNKLTMAHISLQQYLTRPGLSLAYRLIKIEWLTEKIIAHIECTNKGTWNNTQKRIIQRSEM